MEKAICQLTKEDGSPFAIMARVSKALRKSGVSREQIENYRARAMAAGNYNQLLQESMKVLESYGIDYE